MADTIRTGVIGYGLAGRIFHTAVIDATPGLELAAIVQRTGNEAAHDYPDAKIYRSIEQLLEDKSIRLIVVGTPTGSHYEIAKQCLLADRDVVVDKPFTLKSEEAADLIRTARERKKLLTVYQNRRWDGSFKTLRKLLDENTLGRIVSFEAHFDRYRPQPNTARWRENGGADGGILLDLGAHLIDQALVLFGKPDKIFASVRAEREGAKSDDAFDITLFYPKQTVFLRGTNVALAPGAVFTVHGEGGSYVKFGLDPQEDQLKSGKRFNDSSYGYEPELFWGTLYLPEKAPKRIETDQGDYRGLYANVRDALLGQSELAVKPEEGWRTIRIIELASQSSREGRVLDVNFSDEP